MTHDVPGANALVAPCSICGELHHHGRCSHLEIKRLIKDKPIPSKARLTLPEVLELEKMADGSHAVRTGVLLEKGTVFGPYEARKIFTINPATTFPLKIFPGNSTVDGDEFFAHYYLDTSDENECNWMYFVAPAVNSDEQNLLCFQEECKIYYAATRDIEAGEYLRVWYSPHYALKMDKKALPKAESVAAAKALENIDLNNLLRKQQNIVNRDMWTCKFCGRVEKNVVEFAKHMIEHYIMQMKKCCEFCKRGFGTRKSLMKHLRVVHSSKSYCKLTQNADESDKLLTITNEKATILNNNKDVLVGGPLLLSDVLTDSLDNTNVLLKETVQFDIESQNMLAEDNLNLETLLNENGRDLDHFNFEINESQEQFVCDVCLKSFSKVRALVLHLKKHTGEYICKHCLRIFGRKENLQNHVCENNDRTPQYAKCDFCQKIFAQNKYLARHVNTAHLKKYACKSCGKSYGTVAELKEHNCPRLSDNEKKGHACSICEKIFSKESYLKKHVRRHLSSELKKKNTEQPSPVICEVCAGEFENKKSLQQHMKKHSAPLHSCNICERKFHRQNVLENHMLLHGPAKLTCEICYRQFKLQKNLDSHLKASHLPQNVRLKCHRCPADFSRKNTLVKHLKSVHENCCLTCGLEFSSGELLARHKAKTHLVKASSCFTCAYCSKRFALRNSLYRHARNHHPEKDIKTVELLLQDRAERASIENCGAGEEQKNLQQKQQVDPLLDLNDIDMDFNNAEVCLSIPDLYGGDQELPTSLGFGPENVVITNDGGPGEPAKVTLYLLEHGGGDGGLIS